MGDYQKRKSEEKKSDPIIVNTEKLKKTISMQISCIESFKNKINQLLILTKINLL